MSLEAKSIAPPHSVKSGQTDFVIVLFFYRFIAPYAAYADGVPPTAHVCWFSGRMSKSKEGISISVAQRAEARPGNATLLKLWHLFPGADIYAKSEWLNPAGGAIAGAAEFDRARSSEDWSWMVWDIPVVWQWQGLEGALPPRSQLFSHVVPPSPAVDRSGRLRGCAAPARRRCTSSPCRCTSPARCCPGCRTRRRSSEFHQGTGVKMG